MNKYDNLAAEVDNLQDAVNKLKAGELKYHLKRAANIERFALTLAKFKVGDVAVINVDIDFDRAPGWVGSKDQLARGCKVTIRDVKVDNCFEYGCQLEGRDPNRSLYYMSGEWLALGEYCEVKKHVCPHIHSCR